MIGAKYTGTALDYSGYGDANRAFITSLFVSGIDLTTEIIMQVPERGRFGWSGDLCKSLENRNISYKIKIIHLTPDMYPRYLEKDKYNIGHLFWETDRLPTEWITPCNEMKEIWTASKEQAEMIKKSGITVPINFFPQPIDITYPSLEILPYNLPNFNGFIFYSIFQWIERKNPKALIKTYLKIFTGKNDVSLILKTYGVNYADNEVSKIKSEISAIKKELNQEALPQLYIYPKLLTTEKMFRLHKTGNCFVSA